MKATSLYLSVLALLSLSFASCGAPDTALQVPDLGIVVMAPDSYSVQKVTEDGFDIYRVYDGSNVIADFEDHEGYYFSMSEISTVDAIKTLLESEYPSVSILDEDQGEYGATVLYETPDFYGVLSGLEYGDIEVVCQAAEGADPSDKNAVFDICRNALPADVYDQM